MSCPSVRLSCSLVILALLALCALPPAHARVTSGGRVDGPPVVTNYSLPASYCPGADVTITGKDLTVSSTSSFQCTFVFNSSSFSSPSPSPSQSTPSPSSSQSPATPSPSPASSTYSSSSLALVITADNGTEVECPLPEEQGHVVAIQVWRVVDDGNVTTSAAALEDSKQLVGQFATSFTIMAASSRACLARKSGIPDWAFYAGVGGAIVLAAILLAVAIFVFNRAQQRRRQMRRLGRDLEEQDIPLIN